MAEFVASAAEAAAGEVQAAGEAVLPAFVEPVEAGVPATEEVPPVDDPPGPRRAEASRERWRLRRADPPVSVRK